MVFRASAPLVLRFAGRCWPYGPDRVQVDIRPREPGEHRCRVSCDDDALLVDPSLPPPVPDEGPLSAAAQALRALSPTRPLDVRLSGPRPPVPGAEAAGRVALWAAAAAACGAAPPASSCDEDEAARSGHTPDEVTPAHVAWLEEVLLLARGIDEGEPACADPGADLLACAAAGRCTEAARGAGMGARSPRDGDRLEAWRAAGMAARWPLGAGVVLVLAEAGRRAELAAALEEHGLEPLPLRLSGASGLRLEREGADA